MDTFSDQSDEKYDENDINTMISPTCKLFETVPEAKDQLVTLWDLMKNYDWTYVKDNKLGMKLWKGTVDSKTAFMVKKCMTVDRSVDEIIEKLMDPNTTVKAHPKGESAEIVETLSDDAHISHINMSGNMLVSGRDHV